MDHKRTEKHSCLLYTSNVQTPETEFEKNSTRQNEQVERDNAKTELEKVGEAMGINPDDMTQEEKDILAHIFEKRRLHPATKEQKEKLYKNEEKIVSSGEKVKTVKDKRKDEYNLFFIFIKLFFCLLYTSRCV